MVLEEASGASSETSFSEQAPSSDIDPYAGSRTEYREGREVSYLLVTPKGPNAIYVNLNNLPRRFTIFGNQSHPQPLLNTIVESCRITSNVLQRPVTQEEADAFAFYAAKGVRLTSYGTPIGVALATVQCYRTQKNYRFPGWTPMKEGGKYSPDRFGPLRGQMARSAWSVTRYSAYWFVGALLGQLFFGSYALSVGTADRFRDPRLKEVRDAFQNKMRERRGQVPQRQPNDSDGPGQNETYEMARQRRTLQETAKTRGSYGDDDMSPTGGAFQEDFISGSSDGGLMDDGQMRRQDDQRRAGSRTGETSNAWMQPGADSVSTQQSSNRPERSQTQPQSRPQPLRSQTDTDSRSQRSEQSGSVWDRLRQNAMSDQKDQPTPTSTQWQGQAVSQSSRRAASNSNNSFSFSQRDEERQLAKSEAQKEFDARIEREREGKDFDDGSRGSWNR